MEISNMLVFLLFQNFAFKELHISIQYASLSHSGKNPISQISALLSVIIFLILYYEYKLILYAIKMYNDLCINI